MAARKKKATTRSAPPQVAALEASPSVGKQTGSTHRSLVIDERVLFLVGAVAVAVAALWQVRSVLIPLLFVGVVTFIGAPVVARLERAGIGRSVGAGVFLVGLVGLVLGLGALVVPPLVVDVQKLVKTLPALLLQATQFIEANTGATLPRTLNDLTNDATQEILDQLSPVAAKGGALVGAGAAGLARGAASVAGFLGQALLVPVIAFFVLSELPEVKRMLRDLAPERVRLLGARYVPLVDTALSGLIRGQATVVVIMSAIYVVGLGVSGVPLALAIGILAGAAYLIPFASASTALVLSVAFALLELGPAGAKGPIIGAVITCVLVQLIEGYVLTPRIVGEKAGLSPLATLLAVLLGGTAAGFLGVLFALPLGAVVALVLREELLKHSRPVTAESG